MLLAHLVPGYFAASVTQSHWRPEWTPVQRGLLWTAALVSTFAPDLDVIYNATFRRFFNHSTLWTHSLFPHLAIALCWLVLHRIRRWPYVEMFIGLVAIGGLSHLLLDVIAHGTPLLYPLSLQMIGAPPRVVVEGGLRAYLTHPIILLEPLLFLGAAIHFVWRSSMSQSARIMVSAGLVSSFCLFAAAFLSLVA
jgi:membrane-bound metal-dependent hydrolase YbcI (DUF457 family)